MLLRTIFQALPSSERSARFYDFTFRLFGRNLQHHYTSSRYYFLWAVIAERLRQAEASAVLDIGCGSGQLACLLRDQAIVNTYIGIDFSLRRIEQARKVCPQFEFELTDAFKTPLLDTFDYDTVIATEFLEHVREDHAILGRIRPGALFIGTVPDFPSVAHVRHFGDVQEVSARYGAHFEDFDVTPFLAPGRKTYFLIQGVKLGPI
jgi:SAM-dependent methyltransferase